MQPQITKIDFSGQTFYCGIDMHRKSWTIAIEAEDVSMRPFVQDADPDILVNHLKKNYPGASIIAGYEAGYFGYWAQRKLQASGIECLVINPADIPTTNKEKDQKRDPRDSKKNCKSLAEQRCKCDLDPTRFPAGGPSVHEDTEVAIKRSDPN